MSLSSPFVSYCLCVVQLIVGDDVIDLINGAVVSKNINECDSNGPRACQRDTCLNGGTCRDVGLTDFRCSCSLGFTGSTCETRNNGNIYVVMVTID